MNTETKRLKEAFKILAIADELIHQRIIDMIQEARGARRK